MKKYLKKFQRYPKNTARKTMQQNITKAEFEEIMLLAKLSGKYVQVNFYPVNAPTTFSEKTYYVCPNSQELIFTSISNSFGMSSHQFIYDYDDMRVTDAYSSEVIKITDATVSNITLNTLIKL